MTKKLSQYEKYENKHRKATLDIVKFFRKIIKKTLPYHTTNALVEDLEKICDTVDLLESENKRLKEFARIVIRQECWCLDDLDGGDLQELAEKLNLIVPCIAIEEDVDADRAYDVGDTFFKFSDMLKGIEP